VNRIFGNDGPAGDLNGNTNWGSLSYKTPWGALTGYALMIDLDNQNGGAFVGLSSQTFGGRFEGKLKSPKGSTSSMPLTMPTKAIWAKTP
jgi:hypothetical protein